MPNSQKKKKKRKSLRELFKIGKCTSPETTSPEVDESVQNGQDNGDIFEEHHSTDFGIEDVSTEKSYAEEYIKSPESDTELAEQNRCNSDGDIRSTPEYKTSTPEYDTKLAEQNINYSDGEITKSPENNKDIAEKNGNYSDGDTTKSPEYDKELAEQNRCDYVGDITPVQRVFDEQNRYSSDEYDKSSPEHKPLDMEKRRCVSDEIETTCKENDNISIGACSLSNSDVQIDTTSYEKRDTLSKDAVSLSGNDEDGTTLHNEYATTSNKEDDKDGTTSNKEDETTSNKEDDVTSIGACFLSDTDEEIVENHIIVKDDLNSNDLEKHNDTEDASDSSPKTGLYIDSMVMDSQREILLNMKNLIQTNVKQIKDMMKRKTQLNIAVHKAGLRVDRTKKSNAEMEVKITALRADFWKKAKQFPAMVSLKPDNFDNLIRKRKHDIVESLNTVRRKEKILKEVIPELIKENTLRKTWTLTYPVITFSLVIEKLNAQFLEEFGTIFRFLKLKPGIYYRHPFSRTTFYVPEEEVEEFKEQYPHLYYNCQRFLKRNDIEKLNQQALENWYHEKKQGCKTKDNDAKKYGVKNKQAGINKTKAITNGTNLKMKRCDAINKRNGPKDTMVIDSGTSVETQTSVTKTNMKTPKKNYMRKENNNSTEKKDQNKRQTQTKSTRKPNVESNLNVDKAKTTQKNVSSKIDKPRNNREDKIKIDTSSRSKEITRNDKRKTDQKNNEVDQKILERIENLRSQGKDAFIKTSGGKSFIYIKPTATQDIETGIDKNRPLDTGITKRSKIVTDHKVVRRPPSSPMKHAAVDTIGPGYTKQSNSGNISLWGNIRVHAKPVPVKGKTKIPLFIRKNMPNKTLTPRRQPNSNVPSTLIHIGEGQKRSVVQRKNKPSGSQPTVTTITNRNKSYMDKEIPPSRGSFTKVFSMSQQRTLNKLPKESQKPRKSLIPISVRYMKEREQSKGASKKPTSNDNAIAQDTSRELTSNGRVIAQGEKEGVSREPTPYDHIITEVITEYLPWSEDEYEDDEFNNPEVSEEIKPVNSHHDIIPMKEKENKRTKDTIKTESKVKNIAIPRATSNGVSREPTPYDHIITQVISEYLPWPEDEDEDDELNNPEVSENKHENSHHDIIPMKEKENKRTKDTIKTEGKVENIAIPILKEGDNVITRKGRNVILLPPITQSSSPTKRARSRSERCKSHKSNNQGKGNNDSLAVNTLNDMNSVSVTVPNNSATGAKLSGKLMDDKQGHSVLRPQEKRNGMREFIPHPPDSPKGSYNRRRNVRSPKGEEIGTIAAKISNKTNETSDKAFEYGIQDSLNNGRDSFDVLSVSSTFAGYNNTNKDLIEIGSSVKKCEDKLLKRIDGRMSSSDIGEQWNAGTQSLRGQSELRLPPIRNH